MKFNKTIITTVVIIVFSWFSCFILNDFVSAFGILNVWFQTNNKFYDYIFLYGYNIYQKSKLID